MSTTTGELINAGVLMGVIHVLTGSDQLPAMATLSGMNILRRHRNRNSKGNRDGSGQSEAFLLGIKWGITNKIHN